MQGATTHDIFDFRYDQNTTSDFASKVTEDLNKIQDGIGEKMGMLVRFIATFVGSMIYPFTQNWPISLVVCSAIPIMFLVTAITGYFMEKVAKVKNARLYDKYEELFNTNMVLRRKL